MKPYAAFAMILLMESGLSAQGHANGATASFPAGGVVFEQDEHISIAREDLEIGLERIHVHYVFNSSASQPLQRTIGFPLAKVWIGDGPDELTDRAASATDLRNYMAFKVEVNGKPVRPKQHEYAWKDGLNITEWLRARDVPVFAVYNGRDFGLQNLPPSTVDALREANLAEGDVTLYPQWNYQTVYEWQQTFPPGESEVTISYTPLYGVVTTEEKYSMFPGQGDGRYCYDAAFKARFDELRKNRYIEPLTLGYILTTAKNWNGAIGSFRLKVNNPKDILFSFCPPAGLRKSGEDSTWEARDFVPRTEIDMIFMSGYEQ